ncbi:MAG: beta-CASP ribonuclease aCPSF1 [Euryarchaeota archaeon]|nr:beta-CASP ribonuclease aCPSF1 [Euryarchaeota archaeon]
MAADDVLKEIQEKVSRAVPGNLDVTTVEFEGAIVVIYTKDPEKFAEKPDLIRHLAKTLQKRIQIRPHESVLMEPEEAQKHIEKTVPADAGISNVYWAPDIGEVTIEVAKPGLAIGPQGATLNEIRKKIGWAPRVIRTPPIPSKTVQEVRAYIRQSAEQRKQFLRMVGRRLHRGVSEGPHWVRVTGLGAFREVGRSCALLSTQDSKVLVDCGVKFSNDPETPYINLPEVQPFESLDAVVLTHAHLDHSGLVPLLFKYGYKGPIYCTPPTRDLSALLQVDYIKVAAANAAKIPYDSEHVRDFIRNSITLNYGDTTDIAPDVRLTFHNAGHILGSSTCHFHIGDGLYNIAFSGDIKYEKTWLFNPAVNKFPRIETMVMEATYGGSQDFQPSRRSASGEFEKIWKKTHDRGGHMIVPVFAVGRSQEVMIVLEELMRNKQIPEADVWLDGMIWEATAIHTAYPEYLNNQLRASIFHKGENPLLSPIFKRVDSYDTRQKLLDDPDPKIVLATSGMMTGGPVMEYFKAWAPDKRNSLVFVGFNAEGTGGKKLQRGMREFPIQEKGDTRTISVNLELHTIDGFSGHSDRRQLMNYINNMSPRPDRVIIGHGEESKCVDLASSMRKKFGIDARPIYNIETVRLA